VVIALAGVKRLPPIAVWMIAFSIVARVVVIAMGPPALMLWCATPIRLEPIALGALLALSFDRIPKFNHRTRAIMLATGVAIPVMLSSLPIFASTWADAVKFPAVAVACCLVLLAVVGAQTEVFRFPLLVYFGKISYGLYVFHLLAIQFSPRLAIPGVPFGRAVSAFALTVALAAVSYRWYESPFLRLKDRFAHVQSRPV
jgi:peptidoglycan/LPS O-acetylase OafA/YrhL